MSIITLSAVLFQWHWYNWVVSLQWWLGCRPFGMALKWYWCLFKHPPFDCTYSDGTTGWTSMVFMWFDSNLFSRKRNLRLLKFKIAAPSWMWSVKLNVFGSAWEETNTVVKKLTSIREIIVCFRCQTACCVINPLMSSVTASRHLQRVPFRLPAVWFQLIGRLYFIVPEQSVNDFVLSQTLG